MELLSEPVLLVTNPAARRAAALLPVARRAFRDAGVRCDLAPTERPGHAAELAVERSSGYRAVFVLGGDGTVMEVLGALARSGVPVGILPGGTGNLVARSLGIPLDVRRAVDLLLRGRVATMDLGVTGQGRHFAFSVGAGVDARMIAETRAGPKRTFGAAAYAFTAIRCALLPRSFKVRAVVDGEVVERDAAAVMVANSGGVLNDLVTLGPGIRSDDGLLDLCIFSPSGSVQSAALGWRLFTGRFDEHPAMFYRPGREFRIECDPPQIYQADGELLGDTPFEARVEAGAATVIVPDP
ncbi:MAG TPA: diacylglycerol kinase family protein [Gemmatimonadaceae bacterium]|nr:diacylglycerol kinase family protein [Gemmatimonadaceae bacterium]